MSEQPEDRKPDLSSFPRGAISIKGLPVSRNARAQASSLSRKRCVICGANQISHPNRRFFRFPRDPSMSRKWVAACHNPRLEGRTPQQLHISSRVCSFHFTDYSYASCKRHRLGATACPTLNIESNLSSMKEKLSAAMKKEEINSLESSSNDESSMSKKGVKSSDNCLPSVDSEQMNSIDDTNWSFEEIPDDSFPNIYDNTHSPTLSSISPLLKISDITSQTIETKPEESLSTKLYYIQKKYSNSSNRLNDALLTIQQYVPLPVYKYVLSQIHTSSISHFGRRRSL